MALAIMGKNKLHAVTSKFESNFARLRTLSRLKDLRLYPRKPAQAFSASQHKPVMEYLISRHNVPQLVLVYPTMKSPYRS